MVMVGMAPGTGKMETKKMQRFCFYNACFSHYSAGMKRMRIGWMTVGLAGLAGPGVVVLGGERPEAPAVVLDDGENWWTGENVSFGGVLSPHFHFQAVYGWTSSELGHELGAGHHDPVEDGWTVQGFEAGLSARVGRHFEAFGVYHGYWENEDPNDYGDEFEEWFGKVKNLPGGFELRGGRYLNRFGLHNQAHLHAWDWVDNHLVNGRFLGDDGLYTVGGEVTWSLPTPWTSVLSVSVGEARREAHGHGGHEEHEEHEEHGEPGHEAHGEAAFAGGEALFDDVLTVVNWTHAWNPNDFHQFRGGVSGAWGDNAWSRTSRVLGAHFQYEWRQNGLEPGGAYLRWRSEMMFRDFDAVAGAPRRGSQGHVEDEHGEEHGHEHEEHEEERDHEHEAGRRRTESLDDWGWYTSLVYGRPVGAGVLEASLRFDRVADLDEAGLPGRRRISPGLTWYANPQRTFYVRSQYNHDRIDGRGSDDSVWIGFGFNWGGPEVR